MAPAYYNVRDPIENLRIKVSIRKVSHTLKPRKKNRAEVGEASSPSSRPKLSHEPIVKTFKWQEKVFGPREYVRYTHEEEFLSRLGLKEKSRLEDEYRSYFKKESHRQPYQDALKDQDLALFTYIDRDGYISKTEKRRQLTTSQEPISSLGAQVINLPHRSNSQQNQLAEGGASHLLREFPFKIMYIMAAVDLETEHSEEREHSQEEILCTLKLFSNGLLEVSPPFSEAVSDAESPPFGSSQLNRQQNQQSASPLPEQGEVLQSYKITTARGSIYEYVIENDSERVWEDALLLEEMLSYEEHLDEKSIQSRESQAGSGITPTLADEEQARFYLFLELSSLHGFEGSQLYVEYEARIPDDPAWAFHKEMGTSDAGRDRGETHLMMGGVTQSASNVIRPSKDEKLHPEKGLSTPVAYLCFPIESEIIQRKAEEESSLSLPSYELVLRVFSVDFWERHRIEGYGYLRIPLVPGSGLETVHCWTPQGSIRDQVADFFIGGSQFLKEPLAIVSSNREIDGFQRIRSKFGLQVQSTGEVRVRFNVVRQGRAIGDEGEDWNQREEPPRVKRAVADIVASLRRRGRGVVPSSAAIREIKSEDLGSFLQKVKATRLSLLKGPPLDANQGLPSEEGPPR